MAVRLDKVGRVARIILNQPEKMNAMTAQLVEDFGQVLENIHSNASEYGAVVITGAGKAFSAGGDQTWLKQRCKDTAARNSQIMHDFYHRFLAVRSLPLPVVAAINGPAVGAGMCLAMACDIRVAAKTAKMGFPFVSLGLHPGMGATHMIASVAGYETAYRLLLTGDMINGEEAMGMEWWRTAPKNGGQILLDFFWHLKRPLPKVQEQLGDLGRVSLSPTISIS
eukprot:Skav236262  [mRNA]  locus=scaffold829:602197:602868:- [translate_table: standard]